MSIARTKQPRKSGHPRITFFDRVRVLAETVLRHPKSEQEKNEAAKVVELIREHQKAA